MNPTAVAKVQEGETPKAKLFSLKAPYMKEGLSTLRVAETPSMTITLKVHAECDENEIHTHLDIDHSFIVLEGELTIIDPKGNELVVKPYQGVLLPRGTYYRLATGTGNTVVLRINAKVRDQLQAGAPRRVNLDGRETYGRGPKALRHDVEMPGKFFAESAGLD